MMNYISKQTSYELAHELATKAKKVLGLSEYDQETLEHDINNLRAHEWIDLFNMIPDSNEVKKLYFTHCVELEDENEQELEEAMESNKKLMLVWNHFDPSNMNLIYDNDFSRLESYMSTEDDIMYEDEGAVESGIFLLAHNDESEMLSFVGYSIEDVKTKFIQAVEQAKVEAQEYEDEDLNLGDPFYYCMDNLNLSSEEMFNEWINWITSSQVDGDSGYAWHLIDVANKQVLYGSEESEVIFYDSVDEYFNDLTGGLDNTEGEELEENTITNTLPSVIDQFLMDCAQMYCNFDYTDISKFGERATEDEIKLLRKIRADLKDGFDEDDPEVKDIFNEIEKIVKGTGLIESRKKREYVILGVYSGNAEEFIDYGGLDTASAAKKIGDFIYIKTTSAWPGDIGYSWYEELTWPKSLSEGLQQLKDIPNSSSQRFNYNMYILCSYFYDDYSDEYEEDKAYAYLINRNFFTLTKLGGTSIEGWLEDNLSDAEWEEFESRFSSGVEEDNLISVIEYIKEKPELYNKLKSEKGVTEEDINNLFRSGNMNESLNKTYQVTVKYHNEPKEKIEARSAKDRKDLEYQLNMDDEVEWYDFDESQFNESLSNKVKVGDKIKIINMVGEPKYTDKEGIVAYIDDAGQIHGTWGGCAIIPEEDEFEIITSTTMNEDTIVNLTSKEPEDEGEDEEIEEITESVLAGAVLTGLGTSLGAGIINVVQKLFKKDPSKKKSKWKDYKGYIVEITPEKEIHLYDSQSKEVGKGITFHTMKQAQQFIKDLKKGKITNEEPFPEVEAQDNSQNQVNESVLMEKDPNLTDSQKKYVEDMYNKDMEFYGFASYDSEDDFVEDVTVDFDEIEAIEMYKYYKQLHEVNGTDESSNSNMISDLAKELRVNGPRSREDRKPEPIPGCINEINIPDEMRYKEYDFREENGALYIEWITQGLFTSEDVDIFINEVASAIDDVAKDLGIFDEFEVIIEVTSRDGKESGYTKETLRFEPMGTDSEQIEEAKSNNSLSARLKARLNKLTECDSEDQLTEEKLSTRLIRRLNQGKINEASIVEEVNDIELTEESLKWNMGSNKLVPTDSEEFARLVDLAKLLQEKSPNGFMYTVEKTYEDFGAGMQWYNIICHNKKGDRWQVLNTKQWLELANGKLTVEQSYDSIIKDEYFQDKISGDVNTMNHSQLLKFMDSFDEE